MSATLTAEAILQILKGDPRTKDLVKPITEAEEAARLKAAAERDGLLVEKKRIISALAREMEDKRKLADEAAEAARKAGQVCGDVQQKLMAEQNRYDREISTRNRFLEESAPPELLQRRTALKEESERLRNNSSQMSHENLMRRLAEIEEEIKGISHEILNPKEDRK